VLKTFPRLWIQSYRKQCLSGQIVGQSCAHFMNVYWVFKDFTRTFETAVQLRKCRSYAGHITMLPPIHVQNTHLQFLSYCSKTNYGKILTFCWPCISVYLSQYLTNLMQKMCFTISFISCLYMFRAYVLETCRGTYRCDDTRGCVMQFWPPDDEHMCSKHVEAPIGVMIPEAV